MLDRLARRQRFLNLGHRAGAVAGVGQLLPGRLRPAEFAGCQAIHRLQRRRPDVHAGLNVPIECADLRGLGRQPQPLFALAQSLLGPLALGDIAAHRGEADRQAGGILDVENGVDHPDWLTRFEMAEPDFHLGASISDHTRKEFFADETLVFRKEELRDWRRNACSKLSRPTNSNPAWFT